MLHSVQHLCSPQSYNTFFKPTGRKVVCSSEYLDIGDSTMYSNAMVADQLYLYLILVVVVLLVVVCNVYVVVL